LYTYFMLTCKYCFIDFEQANKGPPRQTCSGVCRKRFERMLKGGMPAIDKQEYKNLLSKHDGRCQICKSSSPGKRRKAWSLDHDHTTGTLRGFLCSDCNIGLGSFKDNIESLSNAIDYLSQYKMS